MNDLTREEAVEALLSGKKLTHNYFTNNEWVMMMGDFMLFENNQTQSVDSFWNIRKNDWWNSGWNIVDERRYKSLDDMKSRMQILNEISKKLSNNFCDTFEKACDFGPEPVIKIVYQAMHEYSNQERARSKFRLEEKYTDDRLEEMMIETMKDKWPHCFIDGKLCQRPKNFEDELQYKIAGAKVLLNKII
jgi:hypothetical protein